MITPWGNSDSVEDIGDGILFVTTPSHGGYYVPPALWATMPEPYQTTFAGGTWYEEDCDWAKVVLSFPHLFVGHNILAEAVKIAKSFFPDDYQEVLKTMPEDPHDDRTNKFLVNDYYGGRDDSEPMGSFNLSDDAEALSSSGLGTDEDYGCFDGGFDD